MNGTVLEADVKRLLIPLFGPPKVGGWFSASKWGCYSAGLYVWHDAVRMWIWNGEQKAEWR